MKKLILAAGLLMTATAVPGAAQDTSEPIKTKSGTIDAPQPGMGQVVFYRPGSLMGVALGCTVHEGEEQVARLGSGKYYVVPAAAGKHSYFTEGEAKDTINLEIEPDETYFVKCSIGMGIVAGRANLSPSDRESFEKKAAKLKIWTPKNKD